MPERIRVLELVYSFDVEAGGGGITRFTTGLAEHIDPACFEIILYALADYGTDTGRERIAQLQAKGIRAYTAAAWSEASPYRSFLDALKNLRAFTRGKNVDILHSHSEFSDVAALVLKLEGRTGVIVRTAHNGHWQEWRKRPVRRALLTNFLYPLAYTAEIGISPAVAQRLDRRPAARLLRRKAHQIGNAIDLKRFRSGVSQRASIRTALGIPAEAPVVGTVGRLTEEKGYDVLIRAMAGVLAQQPEAWLVIVGAGPLEAELKAEAERMGIAGRCIFTGPRSDVEALLDGMDAFACSSSWEGQPTAVLESMAAGVPVAAFDIPGTRALIQPSENGLLVPAGDAAALAAALLELLRNRAQAMRLAQHARETAPQFSFQVVAKKHEDLYISLKSR